MKLRSLYIICILAVFILLNSPTIAYADALERLMAKVTFVPKLTVKEDNLENGLTIQYDSPVAGYRDGKFGSWYYGTTMGLLKFYYTITANGVRITMINNSKNVMIIKWSESAITLGSFSGLPFLEDMYYEDAGKPRATPNTLIAPGQKIRKTIFISRVRYYDKVWSILGEPIPVDNSLTCTLVLKVYDDKYNSQYVSSTSNPISVY